MHSVRFKLKIYGILVVYLLAWFYQSWMPFLQQTVFANAPKINTNIVALIVDKNLYTASLKNSIDRYATQYIQSKISNSKAIIFPVDTTTIHARDIAKMLENLYYEGVEEEPSTLKGVILIGQSVPLPVVDDKGVIFPTVFPYVDFDNPKYYRDPATQYFLPDKTTKAQAEIRHSMIDLGSESENYVAFFQKLQSYHTNPSDYVGDKVRYDDLIDQQESFNKNNLTSYLNKFLFAEDLAYHRYNPVLVDLLNIKERQKITDLTANLTGDADDEYLAQVSEVMSGLVDEYNAVAPASSENIPTVFVKDTLKGFQKPYSELYGVASRTRVRDNILAGGRRDESQIDSHDSKIEYYDSLYTKELGSAQVPLLVELNKKLEDVVISAIKTKQYPMHVTVPVSHTVKKHVYTQVWNQNLSLITALLSSFATFSGEDYYYVDRLYEAFYYGRSVTTITGVNQTNIFLGTPNPINNNVNNVANYTGFSSNTSLGSSYGISSQFVEANRGYVSSLAQSDIAPFSNAPNICNNNLANYRDSYLGGNTPLNLTGDGNGGLELRSKQYDHAGVSMLYPLLGGPLGIRQPAGSIFNIAGSKKQDTIQSRMDTTTLSGGFLEKVGYQTLSFGFGGLTKTWQRVNTCNINEIETYPISENDINTITGAVGTGFYKEISVNNQVILSGGIVCPFGSATGTACFPYSDKPSIPGNHYLQKDFLTYKTIDTLLVHSSPTVDEISALQNTTPDRPIDSIRYATFKGIGGDWVKFLLPNLYAIPVYQPEVSDPSTLVLKNVSQIEQSIRDYLRSVIIAYNNSLLQQINNQSQYFNANSSLFTTLGGIDPLATPARPYTLLDINILNNAIDSSIVSSIAELLYVQNSLIPKKKLTTTLGEELEQISTLSNVTNKKELVMKEYLSKQIPSTPLSLPGYEDKGYEVVSLTSNGDDNIYSDIDPANISSLQDQLTTYANYQDSMSSLQNSNNNSQEQNLLQESCASEYGEPVPLVSLSDMSFPRFKMFACRLDKIGKPKITFDFKNAQGPVLTESLFKEFLSDPADIKEHYTIASNPSNPEPTSSSQKALLAKLSVSFSSQNYLLQDDVPNDLQPQLVIEQLDNSPQTLSVTVTSTGTNCLLIEGKNTCTSSYTKSFATKNLILPVDTVTKTSGYINTTIKICNSLQTCVTQTYSLGVSPGPVETITIISPYDAIAQGSPVPISLQATDNYNNAIPFSLTPYTFSTNTGQIGGGLSLSLANFRDVIPLQGPIGSGVITTSLRVTDGQGTVVGSKDIAFSPSKIDVVSGNTYYNSNLNAIDYILPPKKSLIYVQKDKTNIGLLPQLTIDLRSILNNQPLAGPVMLQSEQGLFDIVTTSQNGSVVYNTGLSLVDTLVFENQSQRIIIQPKGNIGSDRIIVQLPDGSQQFINVVIRASGQTAKIDIVPQTDNTVIANNSLVNLDLYLYDDRGNLVTTPASITNESFGSLSFSGASIHTSFSIGGKSSVTVQTTPEGGVGYIVSKMGTGGQTLPGLWKIKIPKSIIPSTNLNALYLNLMGTDRGKRQDKTIDTLFTTSSKLLVTTTQIADPVNLHPSILTITQTGDISGSQKDEWIVVKRNNMIIAQNPTLRQEISLGSVSSVSRGSTLVDTPIVYTENHDLAVTSKWAAGSTNSASSLHIIDTSKNYNPSSISSIQDSNTPNKNIARRHPDGHLTEFAQGKEVGEATLLNGSEFLINYGDPLISRKDKNNVISDTLVDDGPGQMIVSNPTKTVLKSLSIDINNDGLVDIVTIYTDGSVVRSKQYGGKDIFVDMGALLQIFGEIKEVYGVESPDGFDEIMVENKNQQLKIYTNTLGKFDIDGFPVCFNTEKEDHEANSLEQVDQRFVEDMDNDGASDIVINQDSQIKIVYGAAVGNGHSFISENRESCDPVRRTRQSNHMKIVENLATQLSSGPIIDSSLIRWQGLQEDPVSMNTSGDVEDTTISNNSALSSSISNLFNLPNNSSSAQIPNLGNFPLENIVTEANNNLLRRSLSPIDYYPVYETILKDNIRYVSASQLKPQDQVAVTKTYQDLNGGILKQGDKVKVIINISGIRNEPLTYIDRIQGPWIVSMNSNGLLSGRDAGTLPNTAIYKSFDPQDGFMFGVDNITLGSSNLVNFSYELVYQGGSSIKIKIDDRNDDDYKDISIYPLDGCSQFLWTYTNTHSLIQHYRAYNKQFIDVGGKLEDYHNQNQQESQNFISDITNNVEDYVNSEGTAAGSVQNILNEAGSEQMQLGTFLQGIGANSTNDGGAPVNLDLTSITSFGSEVSDKIKGALQDLCNGSSKNSCGGGLPVPFNMSFLSPGTFNIMGCTPKMPQIDDIFPKDNGFPVLAFPATLQTPAGPIPMIFPVGLQQGATDNFGYFGFPAAGGVYPSQIRIYLSPTTTQQMGMAICFGPQAGGMKLPKPFNAIAGNCIVTKVNLGPQSCDNTDPSGAGGLSDQDLLDLAEFGACTQPTSVTNSNTSATIPSSPFSLVSYDSSNGSVSNPFPPGSYFGVVNFEKTPIVTATEFDEDEGVVLKGGQEVNPQVQGGSPKGLVACIVNDWMDRQTNYIINNFTNMQIGIYLPDLSQLGQGFANIGDNVSRDENNSDSPLQDFFSNFGSSGDAINNSIDTFSGDTISQLRNYTINQSSLTELSDGLNNPFDQLAKMFDQTPLIRINTMDVPISVPMIYAEDIAKYESHLKTWIDRNKEISLDWTSLIQGIFGICGKEYTLSPNQVSNASSSLSNVSLAQLDDAFFDDMRGKITANNTKLKQLQGQVTNCAAQSRPNTTQCNALVSTYNLTDAKQKDNMKLFVDNNITTTNACMNIIFQGNDINPRLKTIIGITTQTEQLQNTVRENLKILDQYRRFPLQLYQWIHVVDRYLSELTTTIDNFLGYITLWLNTNATRFEQYVDAIITISTALQTRQAILNLSTDRQKKCSTCSVDNYDAYACSLGFVCEQLKLPILKLSPFKIPNIYIDLSHVDLSMDITLPKFQFIPTSVSLVQIPDLPQVPALTLPGTIEQDFSAQGGKRLIGQIQQVDKINKIFQELNRLIPNQIPLSVGDIPILPSPPNLPELPSFIPNINLELPVLPPAPMIPNLSPQIEGVIKAVSVFSELYCIVKGGVGLLGESNIKTRIEQLTQRTNEIPLFDNINLSKDMSYQQDKLEGFDFQIDAYVNFNLSFDGVYSLINNLAKSINEQTKKLTNWDGRARKATDTLAEAADQLNDVTQQNLNLESPFGYISSGELTDIDSQKENIRQVAQYLIEDDRTPQDKKTLFNDMIATLGQKYAFIPQSKNITNLQRSLSQELTNSRKSLSQLQKSVGNYDKFISDLSQKGDNTYTIYSGETVFSGSLFSGSLPAELKEKQTILPNYIQLQKTLLGFYDQGLNSIRKPDTMATISSIQTDIDYLNQGLDVIGTAYENKSSLKQLAQNQKAYDAYSTLKYNNAAATCSTLGDMTNSSLAVAYSGVSNLYPVAGMSAQVGGPSTAPAASSSYTTSNLYDFSSYKNKVMVPVTTTSGLAYVDTVTSPYFTNNNKGYTILDINNDNKDDILRRDNNSVWIKYADQNDTAIRSDHTHTTQRYLAPVRSQPNQRADDTDDGYLSISDIKVRLSSKDLSVKNLAVKAQDYDSFTIGWTNSERQQNVQGYLIELSTLPDIYHLKAQNTLPTALQSRYVLLLPEENTNDNGYLSIPHQLSTEKIEELLTGTLIDIVRYKPTNTTINYSFTDIDRAWYYTRVVSIEKQGSDQDPVYVPSSPRSHHIVAGQQVVADNQGPLPDVNLLRVKTNQVVDTGLSPQGFVNTTYNLQIARDDPNGVVENRIETSTGIVLGTYSGSTSSLSGLYFESNTTEHYRIGARDTNNNITREQLNLRINTPTITIDDIINQNTPTNGYNIISSLSNQIDEGVVTFERNRNDIRTTLKNTLSVGSSSTFNYPLSLNQTVITGGVYNQSSQIEFYMPDKKLLASMNKEDGEISIASEYASLVAKKLDLKSNTPAVLLYDIVNNNKLFTIQFNTKNPVLEANSPYSLISLSGSVYGGFAGGTCIVGAEHECMIIASPAGDVVIPSPYNTSLQGSYSYNTTTKKTSLQLQTSLGQSVGSVTFNAFIK